jgi:hypothetical protein
MDEEVLHGGIANAGAVTRAGPHVLRPSNPHTAAIHGFLRALADGGFDGASVPIGVDDDGRERLVFVDGDVPVPPYPAWAQEDSALASVASLLARFHAAAREVPSDPARSWSDELADPEGGPVICHNDVCLENVVFRDGVAVGLIDFDYAAPGRPEYDLTQMARMCVPIDDEANAARLGWTPADRPSRLRIVADAYGLDGAGRRALLEILDDSIARSGEFVRKKVEAGEPSFIKMWEELGGVERFDLRRRWWAGSRGRFAAALAVDGDQASRSQRTTSSSSPLSTS